jgi:hypothetical protein
MGFSRMLRITAGLDLRLRIPAGSPWKSASFAFVLKCSIEREIGSTFEDFVYVVTNGCQMFYTSSCSLAYHVLIADWFVPFLGREYVCTWHVDTWQSLIGRFTFTEL